MILLYSPLYVNDSYAVFLFLQITIFYQKCYVYIADNMIHTRTFIASGIGGFFSVIIIGPTYTTKHIAPVALHDIIRV